MRKRVLKSGIAIAATTATVAVASVFASAADATSGPDLAMSGSVVAGVKTVQAGLGTKIPFDFTIRNKSSSSTASDVSFYFTFTNTTGPGAQFYVCPLTSSHMAINPDTPACEPGALGPGKTTHAAVVVTPRAGTTSMTVKACASNLTATDPVPSNNCKSLTIAVS